MDELNNQLRDKNVKIEFSNEVVDHLIKKGFDPAMGARPLGRIIEKEIKRSVSRELLFGKLVNGGSVKVDVKDDDVIINYVSEDVNENTHYQLPFLQEVSV
jgi:ATP-dependent Clp protease ATP-binding subunit ClpA